MIKIIDGLEYEDAKTTPGIGGAPIKAGQVVQIKYKVALTLDDLRYSRNLIDDSDKRDSPVTVTIGQTRLLKGVELGISEMRRGDTRWLKISPDLAFGRRGIPGIVPQNSIIYFEIYISTKQADIKK